MFLQIGTQTRIDNPTPEQIGQSLRNLPSDAPFVILNADDQQFMQATPAKELWRVEWRQEAEQRFMIVSLDRAVDALAAFCRWDEPALRAFSWKRLTLLNDPYRRPLIVLILGLMLVGLIFLVSALAR